MQNAKFNPDAISIVSFFPLDRQPQSALIRKREIIDDLDEFVQLTKKQLPKGGLIVIEQFGKKRQFSQNFWLEPGEELPESKPSTKKKKEEIPSDVLVES